MGERIKGTKRIGSTTESGTKGNKKTREAPTRTTGRQSNGTLTSCLFKSGAKKKIENLATDIRMGRRRQAREHEQRRQMVERSISSFSVAAIRVRR